MDHKNHFDDSIDGGPGRSRGWLRGAIAGGVVLAGLAGAGLLTATGSGFGGDNGSAMRAGGHFIHARMGGFMMERRIGHVLDELDATQEQEDKLWEIIDAARAELRPVAREFHGTREEVIDIIGAATIDREAAEKLRSERIAAIDEASRKMTAALLDAAEVLTAEQRAKLAEHIKERKSRRKW